MEEVTHSCADLSGKAFQAEGRARTKEPVGNVRGVLVKSREACVAGGGV